MRIILDYTDGSNTIEVVRRDSTMVPTKNPDEIEREVEERGLGSLPDHTIADLMVKADVGTSAEVVVTVQRR